MRRVTPYRCPYQHENYNILPNFCVLNPTAQTCVGRSILYGCFKKLGNNFDLKNTQTDERDRLVIIKHLNFIILKDLKE